MEEGRDFLNLTLVVEVKGGPVLLRHLRDQLRKCIEAFPNLTLLCISEATVPDRFSLSDPDNPPPDFK